MNNKDTVNSTPTSSSNPKLEPSWFFKNFGPTLFVVLTSISSLIGGAGGAVIGDEYIEPGPSRPPVTRVVGQEQETQNTEDRFRSILRRAKEREISIESAVLEIVRVLISYRIPLNQDLLDKIRELVRVIVNAGTDLAVEEGVKKLIELLTASLMSTPSPSPTPSPTPPVR